MDSVDSLPTSLPSTSSSESDSSSLIDEGEGGDIKARVKYNLFFEFLRCKEGQNPSAKCKLCHRTYKFTLTSKGNLLKHLQTTHPNKLREHKEEQAKLTSANQQKFNKDGTFIPRTKEPFRNQDKILTSIVRNLCGKGGLAISVVEQSWFRTFTQEVEPKFQLVSRVAVNLKLDKLFEEEKKSLLTDIAKSVIDKPSVTVDLWTGCDTRSFMGCTVHFIHEQHVRSHMLFFVEFPPPHTAQNIKARFEDELDNLGLTCFTITTDNAVNMKCAFEVENQDFEARNVADRNEADRDEDELDDDEINLLSQWTPCEVKVEGWLGCAAHQLQLVVLDGYREIKSYRRVQAVFAKANAIAALSHRSSHFSYSLSKKIPKPCDTRWNSHFHLHEHLIKQCDDINRALQKPTVNRNDLVISATHKEILSLIVDIMQYFSEATDILQAEETPASNHVIPIIDSLENALMQSRSDMASINALCQRLLTSLRGRFGYLLDSPIHKAATAIDPRVKLSFTDHQKEGKVFIFSSHDVKESIKGLIHLCPQVVSTTIEQPVLAKKPKLLDFSSISDHSHSGTMNDVEIELQVYLDQSRVDINPIKFWAERKETPLSLLALKLLSVPCSSAPVERLFSKAGIVLSQRRTRTSSSKLEKLIFLK